MRATTRELQAEARRLSAKMWPPNLWKRSNEIFSWAGVLPFASLFPALIVVFNALRFVGDDTAPGADWAVLELNTRSAVHFEQLLGPYSRFGFNHPGPLFFYLASIPYRVAQNFGALIFVTALLSLVCLAVVLVASRKIWGIRGLWATATMVTVISFRFSPERFRDPWNPYLVILPITLALLLLPLIWRGSLKRALPVFLFACSLALHSHISAVPLVLPALMAAALAWIIHARRTSIRASCRDSVGSLLLLIAIWALPLYEQLTHNTGNARVLFAYSRSHTGDSHSLGEISKPIAVALGLGSEGLGDAFGPASPFNASLSVGPAAIFGLAILASLITTAVTLAFRRKRNDLLALFAVCGFGLLGSVFASLRIEGPIYPYLFTPFLALGFALWISSAATVASLLRFPRCMPTLVMAISAFVFAFAPVARWHSDMTKGLAGFTSTEIESLNRQVEYLCGESGGMITISTTDLWDRAVAVGNFLARCESNVGFSPDLGFIVGENYISTADGTRLWLLLPTDPIPEGATELYRSDALVMYRS